MNSPLVLYDLPLETESLSTLHLDSEVELGEIEDNQKSAAQGSLSSESVISAGD